MALWSNDASMDAAAWMLSSTRSLNNLTNVKITTVYRRRQNTTQNTLENKKKVYNNTNPVFSSSLAHWFQTSVFLLSRCLQSNVLPELPYF